MTKIEGKASDFLSTGALIAVIGGFIWVGTIDSDVSTIRTAMAQDDVRETRDIEADKKAAATMAAVKADVSNIKDTLVRLEKQQREDKKEILDAIRAQ